MKQKNSNFREETLRAEEDEKLDEQDLRYLINFEKIKLGTQGT